MVIDTPDDNNKIVLRKGKPHGSTRWIDAGGHVQPKTTEGAELK